MRLLNRHNVLVSGIIPFVSVFFLMISEAWGATGTATGYAVGSVFGFIAGTVLMYKIHPILGIITLIAGLANLSRMFS